MSEDSNRQLAVKYNHLNIIVNFSDISTLPSPDEAFKKFVNELSSAFHVIRRLRMMFGRTTSSIERQEIFEYLYHSVTATVDFYDLALEYSVECADLLDRGRNISEEVSAEVERKIEFEKSWGPALRGLRAPVFSLKGYIDLVNQYSSVAEKYDEKRNEFLAGFDKGLGNILAILTAYERHLAGEIDLMLYQTDDFFELIEKIKFENGY